MVLRMTSPIRHHTTGIYQYRKRDPVEAKIAHARTSAEVEARWRQLSAGILTLTEKQAVAMAGEIYGELVAQNEDDPSSNEREWGMSRLSLDQIFLRPTQATGELIHLTKEGTDARKFGELMVERVRVNRNDPEIEAYLERHGYRNRGSAINNCQKPLRCSASSR